MLNLFRASPKSQEKENKMYLFRNFLKIIVIALSLVNSAFSENTSIVIEHPTYRDGVLTIPRVDTNGQAGSFQDATFQFDSQTDTWHLLAFKSTPVLQGAFGQVEIIRTDSSPIQVFLKVSGQFSSSCGNFGQINQRLKDNNFDIAVHFTPIPPGTACLMVITPFEKIIPLEVYGLPAGTYEYSVNGEHTGSFTLTKDNTL